MLQSLGPFVRWTPIAIFCQSLIAYWLAMLVFRKLPGFLPSTHNGSVGRARRNVPTPALGFSFHELLNQCKIRKVLVNARLFWTHTDHFQDGVVHIWRPAAPRIDAESGCQRIATHISLFLAFLCISSLTLKPLFLLDLCSA